MIGSSSYVRVSTKNWADPRVELARQAGSHPVPANLIRRKARRGWQQRTARSERPDRVRPPRGLVAPAWPVVLALLALAGCSAETVGELQPARPAGAGQRPRPLHLRPVDRHLDRRRHRRRRHVGPDLLGRGPLQDQAQRDAAAEPLQPADGDLLHDRAVHHHRRAVLLHDPGPERGAGEDVAEPEVTIDVVGQKWSWTFNYKEADNPAVGSDVYEAGTINKTPDPLPAGRQVGPVQPVLARRHPLVLGAGVLPEAGRHPGPEQLLRDDPDPGGHVPRQVRRAVRHLPLGDAVQRARGQRGGVQRLPEDPGRQGPDRRGQGPGRRQLPAGQGRTAEAGPGRRERVRDDHRCSAPRPPPRSRRRRASWARSPGSGWSPPTTR